MNHPRILIDPDIMHGQLVIKGTRIPVELIIDHIAEGYLPEEVIVEYPELTKADIKAALRYASSLLAEGRVAPSFKLTPAS